jgi:two-component system OmpR family sensor kinase
MEQVADFLVRELRSNDVTVAVLDAEGDLIGTSSSGSGEEVQLPDLPAGWAEAALNGYEQSGGAVAQGEQGARWVVTTPGSERQLVVVTPLTVRPAGGTSETLIYLEQVISLGAADEVLAQVQLYILLGIVFGTAIGVVAGMSLTRFILRPLERMVRTAEAIAGGDLTRRLRLPSGRNEVARLGSAFDHMVDRLGAALEAQRRFVADASHELRTPLTSLEGLSEMLLIGADRGDTGVVQRTVRSMHGELARLGRLVADLLTLSRLDNTSPVQLVSLDAGRLANEVVEQMRPLAEAKDVRLAVATAGPAPVLGDPDRLKQVLLNLVDNAIRYTPAEGQVKLSVDTEPSSGARGAVRIEVHDTGPGIAPQDLPHIFDRFYRGDASRTRATGNTGLGLAIARAIVESHSGTISVRSVPGGGATFSVHLPTAKGNALPAPVPVRRVSERRPVEEPVSGRAT